MSKSRLSRKPYGNSTEVLIVFAILASLIMGIFVAVMLSRNSSKNDSKVVDNPVIKVQQTPIVTSFANTNSSGQNKENVKFLIQKDSYGCLEISRIPSGKFTDDVFQMAYDQVTKTYYVEDFFVEKIPGGNEVLKMTVRKKR